MTGKKRTYSRRTALAAMMGLGGVAGHAAWGATTGKRPGTLRAGAYAIDITPQKLPVIVSGSFLEHTASQVVEPLYARCLVLDDERTRIAIAVVDTLFMPRDMLDSVKKAVQGSTGIPTNRILISATHTHSGPSVCGALGSDRDEAYTEFLPSLLVQGIEKACENLEPARVGWGVVQDHEHTHCRRWVYRPDRMLTDPFGERTVRANMHPGHQNPDCVGPAGPADPDITMLSVQSLDGQPIAALANYSMHYYGAAPVSTDYYGPFCAAFTRLIGAGQCAPPFVAMMSHGTSGDQQWYDYSKPKHSWGDRVKYAELVAEKALEAYKSIEYHDNASIQMAERTLTLHRRAPDEDRLAWAKAIMTNMGDRKPQSRPEVYAREAIYLDEDPTCELKLQAIRIGDLGITAIPNEVYALTGLKLKAWSPLQPTMNIELANGSEGYIPPPEQHVLGGYNAWPARTAGLEIQAEPKIVEALLGLLEEVSGKPPRAVVDPEGSYVAKVRASKPAAHWRMGELEGSRALDVGGGDHHGHYEDGVVFYLSGPDGPGFRREGYVNRAAHFAGGRMSATLPELGNTYSVELWFWNGLPSDARPVTGYMFSRGPNSDTGCPGDHLGIGGTHTAQGKLLFYNGDGRRETLCGTSDIGLKTWHHVVLVRNGRRVLVYLDGRTMPEIASDVDVTRPAGTAHLFVGGRSDNFANWEGKIAETAVYNRVLTPDEIARHYISSGVKT